MNFYLCFRASKVELLLNVIVKLILAQNIFVTKIVNRIGGLLFSFIITLS